MAQCKRIQSLNSQKVAELNRRNLRISERSTFSDDWGKKSASLKRRLIFKINTKHFLSLFWVWKKKWSICLEMGKRLLVYKQGINWLSRGEIKLNNSWFIATPLPCSRSKFKSSVKAKNFLNPGPQPFPYIEFILIIDQNKKSKHTQINDIRTRIKRKINSLNLQSLHDFKLLCVR